MAQESQAWTLGVMALYLNGSRIEELSFFRRLIKEAERMNIRAFLFTPEDVDDKRRSIRAHVYDTKRGAWTRRWTDLPDVVFDRCRYQNTPRFKKLREFRAKYDQLLYMNRPLANKWAIHQLLAKDSELRASLPATESYSGTASLAVFTKRHRLVFVKPINGTGGRGVVRIQSVSGGLYTFRGRDRHRRIIPPQKLSLVGVGTQLKRLGLAEKCLMQQGIDLTLPNGRVHDYRLLMQKNGGGEWEAAGCAGRIGAARSVTSNLHGGGKAVSMERLLKHTFPDRKAADQIRSSIERLGKRVVHRLEAQFHDMCELALDIAVDRSGHIWLLEVNPKPAREVFRRIGEKETYRKAIVRPIEYAKWLYEHRKKTAEA